MPDLKSLRVYCINLERRPDRWERFISQQGVKEIMKETKFERFSAIDGKSIDINKDTRVSVRTRRNILLRRRRDHEDLDTIGGIGCYLSHASVWKKFLDSGDEYCIIFEDDALVLSSFLTRFNEGMNSLKDISPSPDLWNLSVPHNQSILASLGVANPVYTNNWAHDIVSPFTGYVLFKKGAQTLLANAFPIDGHVDLFVNRLCQLGIFHTVNYKNISLLQIPVKQGDSNIQANSCELCNLPTSPYRSGYVLMKHQSMISAAILLIGVTGLVLLKIKPIKI